MPRVDRCSAKGWSAWAAGFSLACAVSPLAAQPLEPAHDTTALEAPPSLDRKLIEGLTFYLAMGAYGARTGAMVNHLAGIQLSDDAVVWSVLPVLGAGTGVALAWALDHPRRIRRGRGFSLAAGMTFGQLTATSIGYLRGRSHQPPGDPFSSPFVWFGASAGLSLGLIAGELIDPTAGSATFTVAFGVGGILSGAALCGIVGCGNDLGYYVIGGELALAGGAIAAISLLHPTDAEVRWAVLGALAGALPGALVLGLGDWRAFDFHGDNQLGYALTVGGLLGAGVTSLALARAFGGGTRARTSPTALNLTPTLMATPGALSLGVSFSTL